MAGKKKAKRRIKRINGVLTVVYIDVETGQVLPSLDGYELITADGFSNSSTTPVEAADTTTPLDPRFTPKVSNTPSPNDYSPEQHEINRNRPMGSGNILKDLPGAISDLKGDIDNVKGGTMNALTSLGARLFGGSIGKGIGQDIGKDVRENGIPDGVKDAAGNAISGAGAAVSNLVGSLFGGGNTSTALTNVSSYAPAPTRVPGAVQIPNYPEQIAPTIIDDTQTYSGANLTVGNMSGVNGLIIHHTGGGSSVSGIVNVLEERGFGVQYIMDRDGIVHRIVPEGAKVEHTKPGQGPGVGLTNSNVEGIEIIAADDSDLTPAQTASFARFGVWHSNTHGYDPTTHILGHGEINDHKQETEGQSAKQALLAFLPQAEQVLAEFKAGENPAVGATTRVAEATVSPKLLSSVGQIKAKTGEQLLVDGQPIDPTLVDQPGFLENLTGLKDGWLGDTIGGFFEGEPSPKVDTGTPTQVTDKMSGPVEVADATPFPAPEPFKSRRSEPIVETGTALDAANSMATGLDPVKKAYLDTIHYAEGNPASNQAFGVNAYFEPGRNHPSTFNSEFNTSAAGKYQWTEPTWKEYSAKAGVNDFSNEEHQDLAAWKLAEDNYRAKTGGNLYDALLANDATAFTANANRWSSLPGGRHPRTELPELMNKFNEGLAKYNTPAPREPIAPAPKIETPTGFMAKPKTGPRDISTPTPSRINNTVAKPAVSDKTSMLSDPTITKSKTGGFMPKTTNDKASSSNSSPTVTPNRPATQSPKISGNNSNSSNTPIAGKVKNEPKTNMVTSPSPSTKTSNTAKTPSNTKIADTGTKKEYSYNPSGR